MKIKKGDEIKILSGKDKGKKGKVIKVFPKEAKVLVEGLNMHKKHVRPKQAGRKGEMILLPGPLNIAKVGLICSHCAKAVRVTFEIGGDSKVRICKKCRQAID